MVSIIIPVYNAEKYIARCLNSIVRQNTSEEIECVLVDDCSSDSSLKVAEEILMSVDRPNLEYQIFRQERNSGAAAARNYGIKSCKGEWVFFLDSDDELPPYAIGKLLECSGLSPDVELVQGQLKEVGPKMQKNENSIKCIKILDFENDSLSDIRNSIPVPIGGKMVRKSFITDNDLWFLEGVVHEDVHWYNLAFAYLKRAAVIPDVTYIYYTFQPGSVTDLAFKSNERSANCYCILYNDLYGRLNKSDRIPEYRKSAIEAECIGHYKDKLCYLIAIGNKVDNAIVDNCVIALKAHSKDGDIKKKILALLLQLYGHGNNGKGIHKTACRKVCRYILQKYMKYKR